MCKKLICLFTFVFVFGLVADTSAALEASYDMEEGTVVRWLKEEGSRK